MFRNAFRLITAWSLLALMALVLTPQERLHQCGTPQADHQEHGEGATIGTVCPVCDAALPVAIAAERPLGIVPVAARIQERGEVIRGTVVPPVLRCADRGPPALS